MSNSETFTSITNLYHLFYLQNLNEILVDKECKNYIDGVYNTITQLLQNDFKNEIKKDYIVAKNIHADIIHEFLFNSSLKNKYDLLVVHSKNVTKLLPFMHRCVFIFVYDEKDLNRSLIPYTKINDCFEGVMYINDFHSIIFPTTKLDVYQQTYVRDKPYRFLRKMQQLLSKFQCRTIVEIGTCRTRLNHDLTHINPMCCNDSHSTFFWCE
jgi:hypothetical protein